MFKVCTHICASYRVLFILLQLLFDCLLAQSLFGALDCTQQMNKNRNVPEQSLLTEVLPRTES